jgi:hypothetical protein
MALERQWIQGQGWQTVEATGGGDSLLSLAAVTITSPEMLDIHNTPQEIVAAPGAGKVTVPVYGAAHYRFGTTPYAAAAAAVTWQIAHESNWNNNLGDPYLALLVGADAVPLYQLVVDQSEDRFAAGSFVQNSVPNLLAASSLTDYENQPLMLFGGTAITDGDGELDVTVLYHEITLVIA